MKNDSSTIPAEVFDWMEKHRYEQLSPSQKKVLKGHLSPEEYTEMHIAASDLKRIAPRGKDRIEAELLQAFDGKNRVVFAGRKALRPIGLGKVAALLVLFLSLFGLQYFYYGRQKPQVVETHRVDTLWVEARAPQPVVIRDTVFLREPSISPTRSGKAAAHGHRRPQAPEQELYISGPGELDLPLNRPRQNTLQTDTLIAKYGFVSM